MTDYSTAADELRTFAAKQRVPAVAAAVTDASELRFVGAFGHRSRLNRTAVTVDDAWHIGSCGKAITALSYACLVEEGRAAWETPVTDLFGDIAGVHQDWHQVTVDDLLQGRAGVAANPTSSEMNDAHTSHLPVDEQRTEATRRVLQGAPKEPGRFVYSNLGYVLVGAAIDRLAGGPYESAVDRFVFQPLDVSTAGIGPPPAIHGHYGRLRLGVVAGRGAPADPIDGAPVDNPALLNPAGRFHLSIGDWARIVRVFLNDGSPLLSAGTVERLLADPGAGQRGRSMSMGWGSGARLGITHAMQGSNTMWVATALLDRESGLASLVIVNDGRTSVLTSSAKLAKRLLEAHR